MSAFAAARNDLVKPGAAILYCAMPTSAEADRYAALRRCMVDRDLRARGISDERVLDAMVRVPRHEFVPGPCREQAYEDHPLPIGDGQTISQPYIVAIMLQALELTSADSVMEVGTGSGYVTALLAELTAQVVSIERHTTLAAGARELLVRLGYTTNVQVVVGDGSQGFAEGAPYDAIIVSAAALGIPHALLTQLRDGGRMILPVGPAESQQLQLVRMQNGEPQIALREPCRFVPLISGGSDAPE